MDATSLAWAAGFFDGEGSASAYVPKRSTVARRQMQVSQAGDPGRHPAALVRFRSIVGWGNVTGRYRGRLYYWKTTRNDALDDVIRSLWPYLSVEKQNQLRAMSRQSGRDLEVSTARTVSQDTERAWAAGLFDAEGSVWITRNRTWPDWRGLSMELPQSSGLGTPSVLARFSRVVEVGRVSGPRVQSNPWSRLPQYRWRASSRQAVSTVVTLLWPWLGPVNRARISDLRELLDPGVAVLIEDR